MAWVFLLAVFTARRYLVTRIDTAELTALTRARQERNMGIYMGATRIGYVHTRLEPDDDGSFNLEQEARMVLRIIDQRVPVNMKMRARLSDRSLLERFSFTLDSPFYHMAAHGTVENRSVSFTLSTGKETTSGTVTLTDPPHVSTVSRGYLLAGGLEPGDKLRVPYFDPLTLTARDAIIEYQGKEKTLVGGRIELLHRFQQDYSGVPLSFWLDDRGEVRKEISPAGFVFVSEPEFQARKIDPAGKDLLTAVSIPVANPPDDLNTRRQLTLRLGLPENVAFDLDGGRQSFSGDLLTVLREDLPQPTADVCPAPAETLAATLYVQSHAREIASTAAEVAGEGRPPLQRARLLADWVYEHLEKKPVLGIPSALTVLRSRVGDCNEHAALFAALARNQKIPTRIASGLVFQNGAFFYHAWNEVCIGDRWLSVDTTRGQMPADVGHIRFVLGETADQLRIGALLNRLTLEIIDNEEGQ